MAAQTLGLCHHKMPRALHSTELQSNTLAHAAAPTRGMSVITTEAHRGPSASVVALYEPLQYEGGSPNNK